MALQHSNSLSRYEETRIIYSASFDAHPEAVRDHSIRVRHLLDDHIAIEDQKVSADIVLVELLNNIVEHAYSGETNGEISLDVSLCGDILVIDTIDFGSPIPGLTLPEGKAPDLNVPQEEMPEGKFGWFLIKTIARECSYHRLGDKNVFQLEIGA